MSSKKKSQKAKVRPSAEKLAYLIAEIAESKLAADIILADIGKGSPLADFFVICSVESGPQLKAVGLEITKKLVDEGIKPKKEGVIESGWIVLDFGSVVVHIMKQELREYYQLEQLWQRSAVLYHI